MNEREQQLLREAAGDSGPRLCLRTGTRIDAGRWWRRSPVWLCVTDDELILLAAGRRRLLERIAIAECPGTHYNPATGELVVEPGEPLRLRRLKVAPSEALEILAHFKPAATPTSLTPQR
ncbi:MAG: hypothetical protein HKN82_09800 [Akkermansiaceae bacterium]|nr:hypothetical protein [Akkermansiaceae bacterium]NNM29023.1 hypothetical protein [Akkermansiaceae bacterium]